MEDILYEIEKMRKHFGWDLTDTPEFLVNSIVEEANELQDAFNQQNEGELRKELADVLMYSITLANLLNLDILEIIQEKSTEVMRRNYG